MKQNECDVETHSWSRVAINNTTDEYKTMTTIYPGSLSHRIIRFNLNAKYI